MPDSKLNTFICFVD